MAHKLNYSGHMFIWTFFLAVVYGTRAQSLFAPFSCILYKGLPEHLYTPSGRGG
jgi:hypothetical protein